MEEMIQDFDFDTWFDLFADRCKLLGYYGPIDKYSFEADYEDGETPEFAAERFVSEVLEQ